MQSNLESALYNYITTTNTFNTAIGGRFRFGLLPTGNFPCASGEFLTQVPLRDSCNKWERFTLQITVFTSSGKEALLSVAEKAMTLLDDCEKSLTITGYKAIYVNRIFSSEVPTLDADIYQYVIRYEIEIQKT